MILLLRKPAEKGGAAGPCRRCLQEGGPLVALEYVEIDHVDAVLFLEGLEDGLVCGEVREFYIGAHLQPLPMKF